MKNFVKKIGIIAFVAVIGLGLFTSCEEVPEPSLTVNKAGSTLTTILITGLTEFNGKYASGGLADTGTDDMYLALPVAIVAGSVSWNLLNDKNVPVSVEGSGQIALIIHDANTAESIKASTNTYGTYPKPIIAGANTFAFTDFVKVE